MAKEHPDRLVEGLTACFAKMEEDPSRWRILNREFTENLAAAREVCQGRVDMEAARIKFTTLAGIVIAMHGSSKNKKARMIACEALVRFDAFTYSVFKFRMVNAMRLIEIKERDRRDRGIKDSDAQPSERAEAGV